LCDVIAFLNRISLLQDW